MDGCLIAEAWDGSVASTELLWYLVHGYCKMPVELLGRLFFKALASDKSTKIRQIHLHGLCGAKNHDAVMMNFFGHATVSTGGSGGKSCLIRKSPCTRIERLKAQKQVVSIEIVNATKI